MEKPENPIKSRQNLKYKIMKKYAKPQMMAKNAPTGSYAAGCPANHCNNGTSECKNCDRAA